MSKKPVLILQMQRMGDLILTFPLLQQLHLKDPGRPLHVVAEERFFSALLPFAPTATFFPPGARLRSIPYHQVINLSHRPEAAHLAGSVMAEQRLGPYHDGHTLHVRGFWHLYRTSLTQNNRHNLFHWADLFRLDGTTDGRLTCNLRTDRLPVHNNPRPVGLFVGASEAHKHPQADFWARLANHLLTHGFKPLFLGGNAEAPLGREAARLAGIPHANLCRDLPLSTFAGILQQLDLLITPDTGPMHLAVWLGVPTLNLSMGHVHAWETGPAQSGHYILRASRSCAGCWECPSAPPPCHADFTPAAVGTVAATLLRNPDRLPELHPRGLTLARTGRQPNGLYALQPLTRQMGSTRQRISEFWQHYFLTLYHPSHRADAQRSADDLSANAPESADCLLRGLTGLFRDTAMRAQRGQYDLPGNFWLAHPPLLRPLTGYLHMFLQNAGFSGKAWHTALDAIETGIRFFAGH